MSFWVGFSRNINSHGVGSGTKGFGGRGSDLDGTWFALSNACTRLQDGWEPISIDKQYLLIPMSNLYVEYLTKKNLVFLKE